MAARKAVKARKKAARARKNPPLAIFANPAGDALMSREVIALSYRHAADGKLYRHQFVAGVTMMALRDGSLHLQSARGKRLWGEY